jgi:hypothetical protein
MKVLPFTPELETVARRVGCIEEPQQVIADPPRFVAYAMTHGDHSDVTIIRKYFSDDELRDALDNAPSRIFDPPSWAYWNLMLDRYPTPPMPAEFFATIKPRRGGTIGEFDRGFDENGMPR